MTGRDDSLGILCVIDHFGSGGAQRQMVELACALKTRGHRVQMFVYFPEYDFFRPKIDELRIPVYEHGKGAGFSFAVAAKLSRLMRTGDFDIVLSFLDSPNVYAELARLGGGPCRLVVSERNSHRNSGSGVGARVKRLFHIAADHVVTNSFSHARWLEGKPWLRTKVSCIYNGLDPDAFGPVGPAPASGRDLRLLAIGRVAPQKNVVNLIKALRLFQAEHGFTPSIGWAGRRDDDAVGWAYCREVDALLEDAPEIHRRWHWLGERRDIPDLLREHHALMHPSHYEGLPNAVCEALATGLPVLASNVCDHPLLVADGERGFLSDPNDPADIAASLSRLVGVGADGWSRISRNARDYARSNLSIAKMASSYEFLFRRLIGEGRSVELAP